VTSIWKSPVEGPVRVVRHNVEGDRQSDLEVHGGADKAIYAYPAEHYGPWREELPGTDLPWGAFGENLTTEGLRETEVRIGDRLRVGSVELVVTQPRMPCYKLGIRHGRDDLVKRFLESRRSGFYLSIASEGVLAADDPIEVLLRAEPSLTIREIVDLYVGTGSDTERLRLAAALPALPEGWRAHFLQSLNERAGGGPAG
jgi:MOSC domain-containing protein YiiM